MSDQLIVEREGLEKKDKGELQAIVSALGGTSSARMRKSELIDQILDLSGASARAASDDGEQGTLDDVAEPDDVGDTAADAADDAADTAEDTADDTVGGDSETGTTKERSGASTAATDDKDHPVGPDGEPLADWEVQVLEEGGRSGNGQSKRGRGQRNGKSQGRDKSERSEKPDRGGGRSEQKNQQSKGEQSKSEQSKGEQSKSEQSKGEQSKSEQSKGDGDDDDPNNRRSRRRSRNRGRDRDDAGNDAISNDPIEVQGYLDLRDEGYAFLRVNGFLPSRDDAYVSVKQVRQYGLRKGDHVTGLSRPANRNEKNPALQQLDTINGAAPEESKGRSRFDKLTPVFPDARLALETEGDEPFAATARLIDLLSPIGKGQRGLVVAPPRAGRTTTLKHVAQAIEANHPEVELLMLLIDERPEEVTDMERSLTAGEVVSSTFDRPAEEHTAVAELTLERAKRRVEAGHDVVLLVDGVTRLGRAHNMSISQTGRTLPGGVDSHALHLTKRFMGAARQIEGGGSLTILATVMIETGSAIDDMLFDEFEGTCNMELRLDRRMADRRIFPAIDVAASSTRNEELLREPAETEAVWNLREAAAAAVEEEGAAVGAGLHTVMARLGDKSNAEFLAENS